MKNILTVVSLTIAIAALGSLVVLQNVANNADKQEEAYAYYMKAGEQYGQNVVKLIDSEASSEEILTVVNNMLSDEVKEFIKDTEIVICDTDDEYVTELEKVVSGKINTNTLGYTTSDGKKIIVNKKEGSRMTVYTIFHEIGHVIDKGAKYSKTPEFFVIFYTEKPYSHCAGSNYYNVPGEYFAEMFAASVMTNSPEYITDTKYAPNTLKYIETIIY